MARAHLKQRFAEAVAFHVTAGIQASTVNSGDDVWKNLAAFSLHQALEQSYSCVLLTLTNYGPTSHNIKFLRSLAEKQDLRLVEAFPRDHHRH